MRRIMRRAIATTRDAPAIGSLRIPNMVVIIASESSNQSMFSPDVKTTTIDITA
jgi:hypothetical protein